MRKGTALTVALILALVVASRATAGITWIGGVTFDSLDEAVTYFWEECRDDSLNFEVCFSQQFRDYYPDRRFEPCDRVAGSQHPMPPEVLTWLKRYDSRRVDLRIIFNWAHLDENAAPAAETCKALEAYSHEALIEQEHLKRFNEKHRKQRTSRSTE
jgi:hypothetical protein